MNPLALPGANLVTTVAASSDVVGSGRLLTFTVNVENKGPNDAANLTFTDALPATTLFWSFQAPTGWTCTVPQFMSAGTVSCTSESSANATAQFSLTVRTTRPTAKGAHLSDTATVTSTTLNPNPSPENSASASFVVIN